jgi:hypothetical protein
VVDSALSLIPTELSEKLERLTRSCERSAIAVEAIAAALVKPGDQEVLVRTSEPAKPAAARKR